MEWDKIISAIASSATTVGIFLVWWQIKVSEKLARTQFQDNLTEQYRTVIRDIPTKALLGDELTVEELESALAAFYRYIDLTNEQVFLRQVNRISEDTWLQWRDGIKSQLKRPAFAKAWEIIKTKAPNDFQELRLLEMQDFEIDPSDWDSFLYS